MTIEDTEKTKAGRRGSKQVIAFIIFPVFGICPPPCSPVFSVPPCRVLNYVIRGLGEKACQD
jgi:hypothetical protein